MSLTKLNVAQLKTLGSDNIATDAEVTDLINQHINNPNAHPQYDTAIGGYIENSQKGEAQGVATLGLSGQLSTSELPNIVSNFLKYANFSSLPIVGVDNIFYITLNDNEHYVWSKDSYVQVSFGWKDLTSSVTPRSTTSLAPTLRQLTANVSEFAYGVGDRCEISFHIPHDYVPNTDMFVHVHWTHSGSNISGTFSLSCFSVYAKGHQQEVFTEEKTTTISVPNLNITNCPKFMHRVDEVQLSSKGGGVNLINTDLIETDGFILMTISVNNIPSITGSLYTNEPYIIGLDLHYQCIGLSTKNKSPNFYS